VIDAVYKAKSGHPGGAMSSMDFAYLLYTEFLNFDPNNSKWIGRDRFILSAGHESMLIYSLLHGIGWLETDDLKKFRQLHSKTPGHPENTETPGIECTTGPLGQGAGMSVGFAIGARHLAASLDKELFSYKTWVLLGDGCMQEDITLGAASLAGHLKLNNLIWYYDRNAIQISGSIKRATSDREDQIFAGLGWRVIEVSGHDHAELRKAMIAAKNEDQKPVLIIGTSTMAKGAATLEGSHKTHGEPLPKDEITATKKAWGLPESEFYWPDDVAKHFKRNFAGLESHVKQWHERLKALSTDSTFKTKYLGYFSPVQAGQLPKINWDLAKPMATRNAFGRIIDEWATAIPNLIGGSADLEPSNMTGAFAKHVGDFQANSPEGRNIAFGVREFPMSAITNGLALHGGFVPFDATFLAFADYSRPALRLGAIQKVRVIHEFTHDSFYLGEDGPTHQPIEQIMSLRAIPDLLVMRPADPQETEVLMRESLNRPHDPVCICLTRQSVPYLQGNVAECAKGAWIVKASAHPDMIIFATGSEVGLALNSASQLENEGIAKSVKVVSVPCWELFFTQSLEFRNQILTWDCKRRISIEAGTTLGWERFVSHTGLMIGIDHFGASAPASDLEKQFGFTPELVIKKIKQHNFQI
jgi:transketolase